MLLNYPKLMIVWAKTSSIKQNPCVRFVKGFHKQTFTFFHLVLTRWQRIN